MNMWDNVAGILAGSWSVLFIWIIAGRICPLPDRHPRKKATRFMAVQLACLLTGCLEVPATDADAGTKTGQQSTAPIVNLTAGTAEATATASSSPASSFRVTYLDVGQGDAALVCCDGHSMLIDGGDPAQSDKLYTILKERQITHLDYIVCSHPHRDHAGGLPGALSYASCDIALAPVADSDDGSFITFREALDTHGVPLTVPAVGTVYALGSAAVTILGPTDIEPSMDVNDESLVMRIDYGSTSFLFTGDAEQEEQQLLLFNEYDQLRATVLKASHHGSANGASYAWIKAIQPEVTVISCGKGNDYGHPHQEILDLLSAYGSALYRTDLQGDITVDSDGTDVSVRVETNRDADVWQPGVLPAAAAATATATSTAAPTVQTYILNTHTMKFHDPDCRMAAKIKSANRGTYTGDRQDLIDQGYAPCKVCNP